MTQAEVDHKFLSASKDGKLNSVKLALKHGANINAIKDNFDALMMASFYNHLDIVKYLIENGININTKIRNYTALIWACYNGHLEVVKCLIENNANIEDICSNGDTPLTYASIGGHLDIIKYLIQKGANINVKNNDNNTLLKLANNYNHLDIVKYLKSDVYIDLTLRPDYDFTKPRKQQIIDALKKDPSIIDKLDKKELKEIPKIQHLLKSDEYGLFENEINVNEKFLNAAENGELELVKKLIFQGADINIKTNSNMTALLLASRNNKLEIVKYLIENGVDLNFKNDDGWSAIIFGSYNNCLKIVKYLIEKGANINIKDTYNGNSSLIYAIENNHSKMAELLIENGINLNIKNDEGRNAAMYASFKKNLDILKYLVQKGADIKTKDQFNHDIFYYAQNSKIIKYLKSDAYIDSTLGPNYDFTKPRKQQIIDVLKKDPSIIDKLDKEELKDIPEIQSLLKSDEYGMFEHIKSFQQWKINSK